ncbi:hypothetical protein [Nonomuraea sp. B19D2]|uniref:hypothetical protein n=1 Tax=Nonomuraea sp. B19D2 TaxID=3159561 RepID=UPI0032DB6DD7
MAVGDGGDDEFVGAVVGHIGADMPSLAGAILLLEAERVVGLGQVDRQLTHLIRSGVLRVLAGVALGRFTGFDDYTDRRWNLVDVLRDRLAQLRVPVLGGLDLGHGPDPLAALLGTNAVLDTDAGTLTVEACVR